MPEWKRTVAIETTLIKEGLALSGTTSIKQVRDRRETTEYRAIG